MQKGSAYNAYKNNSVNFASKDQLLLMLLDGTVRFSKIAKEAIKAKDVEKAHSNIVKTQNIYYELMATLDLQKAGSWGENMMNIYEFIARSLIDIDIKKDEKAMENIMPLIIDVKDTWETACKVSKK